MTLHDRIMALDSWTGDTDYGDGFGNGYESGVKTAAEIAKEADELINWCEAHFETIRQLADSAASFDEAMEAINKIKKFKEQPK